MYLRIVVSVFYGEEVVFITAKDFGFEKVSMPMKADMPPMTTMTANRARAKFCLQSRVKMLPTALTAPVLNKPALNTNMAPIVTVAGLLNPESPSSSEMMPLPSRVAMMMSATRSIGSFSVANRITATKTNPSTITISSVIKS